MSTAANPSDEPPKPTVTSTRFQSNYSPELRTAVVAKVAAGATQTAVAEEYGLPLSTVNLWVRSVEKAVPEFENWRDGEAARALRMVRRGDVIIDDHKAYTAGMAMLEKLGLIGRQDTTNVAIKVEAWLGSAGATAAVARLSTAIAVEAGPTGEAGPGVTPPTGQD